MEDCIVWLSIFILFYIWLKNKKGDSDAKYLY